MKRTFFLLLAALLILTELTACGDSEKSGAGHSFSYTLVGNPDTLDPQLAVSTSAKTVLANLFEGLFTIDDEGTLQNGIVKEYRISDDGLHYSFDLRTDSFWYRAVDGLTGYDKDASVHVTAADFVFAFQRIFDPIYESPYREAFSSIKYARDIINGKQDPSMIGVYARSDDLLQIDLDKADSGLLIKLAETAAFPCNQDYFQMTKGRYGLDEQSIIGNGSFSMQRWLYDPYGKYNVLQLSRNPLNHAVKKVFPTDIRFFIEDTDDDSIRIFTEGNTDCCVSTRQDLMDDPSVSASGSFSMTLGIIANPESVFGNAPSVLNAMRTALDYSKIPQINDLLPASGILPPASILMNKSCRELISDVTYRKNNPEQAREMLADALASSEQNELPEGKVLVPNGLMDYSILLSVFQQWEIALSLHFTLEEVVPAEFEDRLKSGNYTLALCTLTGENNTPGSVIERFLSEPYLHCGAQEFLRNCLTDAAQSSELTKTVALFSQAESEILKDGCFVPLFYKKRFLISKSGVVDVHFNPFSGQVQFRDAKFFD